MAGTNTESNEKRDYLIAMCYECYVENGIENTSIRDFCRAGNLNPNTIYYYFKDKDEILFECVNFGYKKLEDAMYQAVEEGNPEQIFKNIKDVWISFSPEMRFLCQAVSSPSYEDNRTFQLAKVNNFYERFGKRFSQRFGCPYEIIRSHINDIFILMSYWSLWGSINMATIQCQKIFQELMVSVENYRKQQGN